MKIIFYELNEIPHNLFIDYAKKYKKSSIAELINKGITIKTKCNDNGELHPWTSWPTLHMGVCAEKHNYRYLNQDKHTNYLYPPIWDLAIKSKFTVGIFGLLQSKMNKDLENNYKFFVPDTFNIIDSCKPISLSCFQKLNTYFVSKLRIKNQTLNIKLVILFIKNILKRNLTMVSLFLITKQLILENIFRTTKFYRTIVQHDLSSILFQKLLKKYKPDFAIFFTNHLASSMHRYLKFTNLNRSYFSMPNIKKDSVRKGLNAADKQIRGLIKFAKRHDYEILLASSIGQELINPSFYESYNIKDFTKFANKINNDEYLVELLPGMYPEYILKFQNRISLENFLKKIENIKTLKKEKVFGYQYINSGDLTLNIKFIHHHNVIDKSKNYNINNLKSELIFEERIVSIEEFGIEIFKRGEATAYHIPEGVLCLTNFSGKTKEALHNFSGKEIMDIRNTANLIMKVLKLK